MQEYEQLVPDVETFARVWKRVMPDENMSPIVVHHPPAAKQLNPVPPPPKPEPRHDEVRLRELLEQMEEGMAGVDEILRRDGGAWPLRESIQKSAAQLRAAWMLLTGRRWQGGRKRYPVPGRMEALLREQYLWELRFAQLCKEAAEQINAADAAEIMHGQEEASRRRRTMLRHMLARER